jgi:hypothetical protein
MGDVNIFKTAKFQFIIFYYYRVSDLANHR